MKRHIGETRALERWLKRTRDEVRCLNRRAALAGKDQVVLLPAVDRALVVLARLMFLQDGAEHGRQRQHSHACLCFGWNEDERTWSVWSFLALNGAGHSQ